MPINNDNSIGFEWIRVTSIYPIVNISAIKKNYRFLLSSTMKQNTFWQKFCANHLRHIARCRKLHQLYNKSQKNRVCSLPTEERCVFMRAECAAAYVSISVCVCVFVGECVFESSNQLPSLASVANLKLFFESTHSQEKNKVRDTNRIYRFGWAECEFNCSNSIVIRVEMLWERYNEGTANKSDKKKNTDILLDRPQFLSGYIGFVDVFV